MSDLEKRLDRIQRELDAIRTESQNKFVQVSFLPESCYTYIDGIGDLKPGDFVVAPTHFDPTRQAVVVALGPNEVNPWRGPWAKIVRRA